MPFLKIASVTGLTEVVMKKPLLGGEERASFNEEELTKIEQALSEKKDNSLKEQLDAVVNEKIELENALTQIKQSVSAALKINGLEDKSNVIKNIEELGIKCKEYGDKKTVHSTIFNNGSESTDEVSDAVFIATDLHNNI